MLFSSPNPHSNYDDAGRRTAPPQYSRDYINQRTLERRKQDPSVIRGSLFDAVMAMGADPGQASLLTAPLSLFPVVGDAQDAEDAARAFANGELLTAGVMLGAAALPVASASAVKEMQGRLPQEVAQTIGRDFRLPRNKRTKAMDRFLQDRGFDEVDFDDALGLAREQSKLRRARADARHVKDPLATPGRYLSEKESRERLARAQADHASHLARFRRNDPGWSKRFQNEVDEAAKLAASGMVPEWQRAINRANMEAVPRALKRQGWSVRHASSGQDGRRSSRYLVSPDGSFEIRLSDHYLPDTQRRAMTSTAWDDELVLHGNERSDEVIAGIKQMYRDHKSWD